MNSTRDNPSLLRRLGMAAVAGALALGASGAAMAHGGGPKHRDVVHHYHNGHGKGCRGHGRHEKVVHVYHYGQPRPARTVVYERPVVYQQPVVVERYPQPEVAYPAAEPGYTRVTPTLNAGSLMGAALGGLIGSQIGGGTGKLAATAAGTVGGFVLGDHVTRYR